MTFSWPVCFIRLNVYSFCALINFSWPCLHQWLETRPNRPMCPVCKAGISKDKVIPLYGRGNANQQDPRFVLGVSYRCDLCVTSVRVGKVM